MGNIEVTLLGCAGSTRGSDLKQGATDDGHNSSDALPPSTVIPPDSLLLPQDGSAPGTLLLRLKEPSMRDGLNQLGSP
jgi:hypothetical protein